MQLYIHTITTLISLDSICKLNVVSFKFCNHLDGEEITGCFTLIVFMMSVDVLTVRGLVMVFPDHTSLLFGNAKNGARRKLLACSLV